MAGKTKTSDARVDAANEIYKVARADADLEIAKLKGEIEGIRAEAESFGILRKIDYDVAHNEFLKLVVLYRVKQNKEYRAAGLTWDDFCDAVGVERRQTDRLLAEVKPAFEAFSDKMSNLCGMPLNKIRLLGRTVSDNLSNFEDGCLVYGDEKIPLTPDHKEDIEALIDKIVEEQTTLKDELIAEKKTHKRVQEASHKEIVKLQKENDQYLKKAEARGLTLEEDAFITKVAGFRDLAQGALIALDPNAEDNIIQTELTMRMKTSIIAAVHTLKMQTLAIYDTVITQIGDPTINPEVLEDYSRWEEENGFASG